MEKVVSTRTAFHLLVLYALMILNLVIFGVAYSDLKEFRNRLQESKQNAQSGQPPQSVTGISTVAPEAVSTPPPQAPPVQVVGEWEMDVLFNTLLSHAICLGVLIILAPIFIILAAQGKFGYGGEETTVALNIFLFAGVALSLGIGITISFITYRLQCTEISRSIMIKLVIAAILTVFPPIFIIFLQINERVSKFGDLLEKETLRERTTQAAVEKLFITGAAKKVASNIGGSAATAASLEKIGTGAALLTGQQMR